MKRKLNKYNSYKTVTVNYIYNLYNSYYYKNGKLTHQILEQQFYLTLFT